MFAYCGNNPILFDDPSGNLTRGQIHNLVLDDIIRTEKMKGRDTLSRRKTCIYYNKVDFTGGWGFCDLYDSDSGEVWELKRITCDGQSAEDQLEAYVGGVLKHNKTLSLKTGGRLIPNGVVHCFSYRDRSGTYNIKYWDGGNGILWYDYTYQPSDQQKQINAAIMIVATVAVCATVGGAILHLGGTAAVGSTIIPFVPIASEQLSRVA